MIVVSDDPPVARTSRGRPRPTIHEGPPSLLYTVKQVELAVRHHLDDLLRPSGLTTQQYTALTVLERRDGLSLTELAQNSFVKVQSMADVLRPLYERVLIASRPDPTHRRRRLIGLEPAGLLLLREQEQQVRQLEERMLATFSGSEIDLLRGMLARCRTSLSDELR